MHKTIFTAVAVKGAIGPRAMRSRHHYYSDLMVEVSLQGSENECVGGGGNSTRGPEFQVEWSECWEVLTTCQAVQYVDHPEAVTEKHVLTRMRTHELFFV